MSLKTKNILATHPTVDFRAQRKGISAFAQRKPGMIGKLAHRSRVSLARNGGLRSPDAS